MLLTVIKASDEVQSLGGQAKLSALVQAAPMAVVSADCDGKVTSWNPAAEKIFGWTEREVLGTCGVTWTPDQRLKQFASHERTLRDRSAHLCGLAARRRHALQHLFPAARFASIDAPVALRSTTNETGQQVTILLADDEPSLRAAIVEYLRGAGHRVLESQSADDALELARSHSGCIDVLLTDIIMPGLRGTELAQKVQQLCPDVHVIYISGYAQSPPRRRFPEARPFCKNHFGWPIWANSLNSCQGRCEAAVPSFHAYVSNGARTRYRDGVFARSRATGARTCTHTGAAF